MRDLPWPRTLWMLQIIAPTLLHGILQGATALPYTQSTVESGHAAAGVVNLPQFDPDLGLLDSVAITIESVTSLSAAITGINPGSQPDSLGASLAAQMVLTVDGIQVQATLSGSASLSLDPGANQTTSLTASAVAATQVLPLTPDSEWIGRGIRTVPWQLTNPDPIFTGVTSTGSSVIQSLNLTVTVTYTYTRLLEPDPAAGTIRVTDDGRPMRIEFTRDPLESAVWTPFLKTGTNPVGTIVHLPLDGASGFYRAVPE
ncbi:MAG: hypothetical protein J0L84_03045 [Verrucomicrobia bacterium]|nr:hypothetical protein [Verrucomicrobiota bacterium]